MAGPWQLHSPDHDWGRGREYVWVRSPQMPGHSWMGGGNTAAWQNTDRGSWGQGMQDAALVPRDHPVSQGEADHMNPPRTNGQTNPHGPHPDPSGRVAKVVVPKAFSTS